MRKNMILIFSFVLNLLVRLNFALILIQKPLKSKVKKTMTYKKNMKRIFKRYFKYFCLTE